MAKSKLSIAFIAMMALCVSSAAGIGSFVYVSNSGDDSNDGSIDHPVATLHGAQRLVRQKKSPTNSVTVWIEPGYYVMAHANPAGTLVFTPEDSGTLQAPISYVGAGDAGSIIVSGGLRVTGWARHPGTSIWTAPLPASVANTYALFADGQRQTPARTPLSQYSATGDYYIQYNAGVVKTIPRNPQDVRLVLYETWTASVHQISGFMVEQNIVNFTNRFDKEWASASGGRYYFENMLEAMDTIGEFYVDRVAHTITWYAPPAQDPNEMMLVVPTVTELVQLFGTLETGNFVEHIRFVNISFMHSDANYTSCYDTPCNDQSGNFLTTAAVHLRGARFIDFTDVSIAHAGSYGLWMDQGTFNNTFTFSHVYDVGAGAVRLGVGVRGSEPRLFFRSESNTVTDNVLEDGGHVIIEGAGVLAQSIALSDVSHNIITNFHYTGVSLGWTWGYAGTDMHDNHIDYNAINTIGQSSLSDMGGVYTLGISPGSTVRNNVVHTVFSFDYGGWAYYTDEGSTNYTYSDNIAFNTKCAGHHQHYGLDNLITNNVYAYVNVAGCDGGVRNSQHAGHNVDCQHIDPSEGEDMGQCSSFKLIRNIIRPSTGNTVGCSIPYAYINCSVDLNVHYSNTPAAQLDFPTNTSTDTFAKWQSIGRDVHGVIADPQFAEGATDEYSSLLPGSPALARGFQPIDISTVGPRRAPGDVSDARFKELREAAFTVKIESNPVRLTDAERAQYERNFYNNRVARRRY